VTSATGEDAAMSFDEAPEHRLLRETIAKVCQDFGPAYFQEKASSDEPMDELWRALAQAGLIGVNLPEEYGGGGGGISELAIVCEETAAAGVPLLLLLVSSAICGEILKSHGTAAQRARWLPPMASGQDKMAFAITEPDAGSNTHRLSTRATPGKGGWQISGRKWYISGVDEASAMLVVARTGEDAGKRGRMTLFIVDTSAPGLSKRRIPVEINLPEKQYELFFDDVWIEDDRRVGEAGQGMSFLFQGLNPERITGAAIENGIARYALARASRYARERRVWDVPIGSHQGIAHPLAEAAINVELARLATAKAAWLHDRGRPAGEASNMAKFAAAEAALRALDVAIQAHGGSGLASEYRIAHLWGLARLLRIAPVSREMILNYVATHTLGLPRSY
jgi:alkylation response protein AidB-like acyl-CoA dehydrogenase